MVSEYIYLDNAATTFPKPEEVYVAMDNLNRTGAVNAGRGSYKLAQIASELLYDTKNKIANLCNASNAAKVIFTPSITIALNQILQGIQLKDGANIYLSPYEHNAVARTIELITEESTYNVYELPMDDNTYEINLDKTQSMFAIHEPSLVCCTHISNVTGYILPVETIFDMSKKYNSINVLDTAQSAGLISIDLNVIKADFVAFAGHKTLYGPFGIGGFIDVNGIELREVIVGGTGSDSLNLYMPENSPEKYESSSQNIVAIAGLNAALDLLDKNGVHYKKEKELTDYLVDNLSNVEGVKLYIPSDREKHVSIVSFNVDGYKADDVGNILDEEFNIEVRTGYHCAPFIHKHLNDIDSLGTVRVGIGIFNSKEDIDKLVECITEITEY